MAGATERRDGVSVRDAVGVPLFPPPAVAAATDRLRARLGRLHRSMAPPPVQILEGLFGVLDLAALGALCNLDIPDELDQPASVGELARRVEADPDVVGRITAYAAARGWLRIDRRGRVRSNRTTRFLRRDHPGGWRAWVEFATGPEVIAAVEALATRPREPDAFAAANGASFFDWQESKPERHQAFDAAMAAGGRLHGLVLADAVDWSGMALVCDVGGGTGALLGCLLDRHRHLHGVLLDLPPVVARARPHDRLEVFGGDAFAELPEGCDAYLFVNVLHDWDDEHCVQLLRNVGAARRQPEAAAIVVEGERRTRPLDNLAARTDLLMLALAPGGRERTTSELADLAARAGMGLQRTIRLPSGDRAHLIS